MSHLYRVLTNTKNRSPKIHYQEYLEHGDSPKYENLNDIASVDLDTDLIWSSYYEKRKFRRTARKLSHVSYR
jgi:hypothetical protein